MTLISGSVRENARFLSAGVLLTLFSSFGQTFFIGLFAGHVQSSFGLSHGAWGAIYALGTMSSAAVMVWAGQLADHMRVRALGQATLLTLAISCLMMALNPWLWALPLLVFLLRLSGQGMMSHLATVAMARWYVKNRGRALALASLGFWCGQAALPIVVVSLSALGWDWRWIWALGAGLVLAVIPLLTQLLSSERKPGDHGASDSALGMRGRHWTRVEALKHPLIWCMIPALLGPSAFNTAVFFFQAHIAEVKSISDMQMVAQYPLYTAVSIVSMLTCGALLDRTGTPRLIPWHQVPMILAFLFFALGNEGIGLSLGFVCLALNAGAMATIVPAFWAEIYGTADIGGIKAMTAAIMVLGSALGPGLVGLLLDSGVGIETQFLWIACYFGVATGLMVFGLFQARAELPAETGR